MSVALKDVTQSFALPTAIIVNPHEYPGLPMCTAKWPFVQTTPEQHVSVDPAPGAPPHDMTSPKFEDFTHTADVRGSAPLGSGSAAVVERTVPSERKAAEFASPARFGINVRPAGFATVRPAREAAPSNVYASM